MREFQKDHTTPEQSKRLLELGVPADSADCYHVTKNNYTAILHNELFTKCRDNMIKVSKITYRKEMQNDDVLPFWSALRLMEIIDICALGESSEPNIEEYPSTIKVMNKLHIHYVEYLVKSIERAVQLGTIDFSKLDIQ